jgi:hypothetical protein
MVDSHQLITKIGQAVREGRYRYTVHAAQQLIARRIRTEEVQQAIASGEVIEDYPQHHYGPACLILGRTRRGRVLHVLCALKPVVAVITVYEPSPEKWEADWKRRRRG